MTRKIYLEGELGAKFGNEYTMTVDSFSEVFRCLECNFSDFRKYLVSCDEKNIGFVCEVAGNPLNSEAELLLEYKEGDMIITPLPMGSKSGAGKILAAVAIMAAVVFVPHLMAGGLQGLGATISSAGLGNTMAAGFYASGTAGLVATTVAINLAMTGIQQMMAPDPSTDSDQDESYLFQGTGQTLIEGDPVPVLYGKLRVPGRPISLQVRNERLNFYDAGGTWTDSPADTNNPAPVNPPGGGGGGGRGAPAEEREQHVFR